MNSMKFKLFAGLISMLIIFLISRPTIHNLYYIADYIPNADSRQAHAAVSHVAAPSASLQPQNIAEPEDDEPGYCEEDYEDEYSEPEDYEPEAPPEYHEPDCESENDDNEREIVAPNSFMVALTFDDGPCENTEKILDILEYHGVLATFCVLGSRIRHNEDILMRAFNAGHEIVGHSWDHSRFTVLSRDDIKNQIVTTNDEIYRATGVMPRFHRPPYGAMNANVICVTEELDMAILMWSIDPRDWAHGATAQGIYDHIMERLFDGSILLFHDVHDVTVLAIEKIVPSLIERGYQLVTVSEMFGFDCEYSDKEIEAGRIYRFRCIYYD